MNKGTYGHPGGVIHAGLHGWATYIILMFFVSWPAALTAGFVDTFVHYHIDWAKMNLNKKMGWRADTHEEFWTLLGLDQFLHAMTYIAIVAFIV